MEAADQFMARLRWGKEEHLLYAGQTLKVGRTTDNDIVVDDPKVSRSHAVLEWHGSGFALRDLGSANGTFINDQRLASAARLLRDGDLIRFGRISLIYEIARAPAETHPLNPHTVAETNLPPAPPLSSPLLIVAAGPDMGQTYPLWGETITIGRASREATWEIRLTDRSVSRPHARLEAHEDGSYYLLDLESANGTLLNGCALTAPTRLTPGDVISVGETRLIFR